MKLATCFKGIKAQLRVELAAAEKGYLVSIPTSHSCIYDILLDDGKKIKKCQIKYCNRIGHRDHLEVPLFNQASKRKFYKRTDIDILFVYIPIHDVILKYNSHFFDKKGTFPINLKNKESKYFWKKYIW
jgi:hypothetical protein